MICTECRAGWHALCDTPADDDCCCGGRDLLLAAERALELDDAEHAGSLVGAETVAGALYALEHGMEPKAKRGPVAAPPAHASIDDAPATTAGDSGYIHPDAWGSPANIGMLDDPRSTGRKRAARMFPIGGGQVCDWAGKKDCGGGVKPIVGCINSPAADIHHGADKNTLNNARKSAGIGTTQNIHLICSDCHAMWHARNDPYYPAYDRQTQQAEPWLPFSNEPWGPQEPSPATFDELAVEERRRHEQLKQRGREHRGRNAAPRAGNTGVEPDGE